MLEKREFETNDFLWRLSSAVAVVSGFFSLLVFLLLVINYLQIRAADPVNHELITKMRQEYAVKPEKDEALAQRIRDLDLLNRKAFFTTQYHLRTGGILLLVGVSVFMISFKYSIRWQREKPELEEVPTAEQEFLAFAQSRQLIVWAGVGVLAVGLGAALFTESALVNESRMVASADDGGGNGSESAEAIPKQEFVAPTWEDIQKNWPSFRGPGSNGRAHFANAPANWDVQAGTGVRWKAEVPLHGPNSPVVWDKKIFMSGADEKRREIYCFDADSGNLIWTKAVEGIKGAPTTVPKVTEETGFAAPSMVAHGNQVSAIFADGNLVTLDLDGNVLWSKNLGTPQNHYGHSSSLLAYDKLLYVQLDQSKDPKLMALDMATGNQVWVANRQTISWASPIVVDTDFGKQLILNSETTVDSYDPLAGTMLWTQECLSGEVAPSPTYSNGVVFSAQEYATAAAIQLAKNDETITPEIAWEFDELLPEVSSPVGDGERFYFGTSTGTFVCLDAKSGEMLWEHEAHDGFYSSPVVVGDKIYVLDNSGAMYILQAGPELNVVATLSMGEPTFATPAFLDGRIYIRAEKTLYCIEQPNA
ncbi:MAG: hypothetical protein AMXMBFR84_35580 [Candidatus Hydrogenedentota bacterium]